MDTLHWTLHGPVRLIRLRLRRARQLDGARCQHARERGWRIRAKRYRTANDRILRAVAQTFMVCRRDALPSTRLPPHVAQEAGAVGERSDAEDLGHRLAEIGERLA